jgi:hypothetical protein
MRVVVKLRHYIVGVFVALAVASLWSVSANARWLAPMLGRGHGAAGSTFANEDARPASLIVSGISSPFAALSPGRTAEMRVSVTNPNEFALTITSVVGAGAITSDKGSACNRSTGVTFANTTGLHRVVGGRQTVTFSLGGKTAMTNTSDTSCQGATFTIPVSVTASS